MKDSSINIQFYFKKIQSSGLRLTKQRCMVIECLMDNKGWHVIDDIVHHIKVKSNKNLNISSIYNTLHSFVKIGIVNAFLDIKSFKIFFDLKHSEHEHSYFFDTTHKKYITVPFSSDMDKKIKSFFEKNNLFVNDYYIVANGKSKRKL